MSVFVRPRTPTPVPRAPSILTQARRPR